MQEFATSPTMVPQYRSLDVVHVSAMKVLSAFVRGGRYIIQRTKSKTDKNWLRLRGGWFGLGVAEKEESRNYSSCSRFRGRASATTAIRKCPARSSGAVDIFCNLPSPKRTRIDFGGGDLVGGVDQRVVAMVGAWVKETETCFAFAHNFGSSVDTSQESQHPAVK